MILSKRIQTVIFRAGLLRDTQVIEILDLECEAGASLTGLGTAIR